MYFRDLQQTRGCLKTVKENQGLQAHIEPATRVQRDGMKNKDQVVTVEAKPLPPHLSTQEAELTSLTCALEEENSFQRRDFVRASDSWEAEPLDGLKFLFKRKPTEVEKKVSRERPERKPD